MKRIILIMLCLCMLSLTACGQPAGETASAPSAQLPESAAATPAVTVEEQSAGTAKTGLSAGIYHLFHDEDLCDTVRFVDGETEGCNNYADGEPVRTLKDCLVRVVVTFRFEEESWSLIYAPVMGEGFNHYAWVRSEALTEYDRAAMEERLTYPVRVREGTVLSDENHGGKEIAAWNGEYWLARRDGKLFIEMEGGISCPVDPDDVIFPDVQNNEIVWDE